MPSLPPASPQVMGIELYPGLFVFVSPTTHLLVYLQREMRLSIGWIPRSVIAGSWSMNILNFNRYCQITFLKRCSNSQLQAACECLSPHIPTHSQHWLVSIFSFFASLGVLGLVEGIVVILTCVILIFSVFFFFLNLTCAYCLLAFPPVFAESL